MPGIGIAQEIVLHPNAPMADEGDQENDNRRAQKAQREKCVTTKQIDAEFVKHGDDVALLADVRKFRSTSKNTSLTLSVGGGTGTISSNGHT